MPIRVFAPHDREEALLDASGDGATATIADLPMVHRAHRCDLRRRTDEEDLIGSVQGFTRDPGLVDGYPKVTLRAE